jgi:hypothetical protein
MAIWIGEVAAASTPRCGLRRLRNLAAGAFGFGQYCIDAFFGANDVGQRDAVKTAALRGYAGVVGERVPPVERQRRRAVGRTEADDSPWS